MVIKYETPIDYVDFTSLPVAAKRSSRSSNAELALLHRKVASPMKNWKGEEMSLTPGAAYVFIVVEE